MGSGWDPAGAAVRPSTVHAREAGAGVFLRRSRRRGATKPVTCLPRDGGLQGHSVRAQYTRGARRAGRAVVFVDETGHSFLARLGTTWAPVGRPPVLRRVSKRRE